jgi:hypothetical protein
MFRSVVKILEYVEEDGKDAYRQRQANSLLKYFQTFDYVLFLHMMMTILALTNGLSKTLQTKDMDIVNAISDIESIKQELGKLRIYKGPRLYRAGGTSNSSPSGAGFLYTPVSIIPIIGDGCF